MDTLIPGLVLLAIGALGWTAAYEPEFYRRYCFGPLFIVATTLLMILNVWNMGVLFGGMAATPFVVPEKMEAATLAENGTQIPASWLFGGYITLLLTLAVLRLLSDYRESKFAAPAMNQNDDQSSDKN